MGETQSVFSKSLHYNGLFSLSQLNQVIASWFSEYGYDANEVKNSEEIHEDGKYITILLLPSKKAGSYIKFDMQLVISTSKVQVVEIEKKKVKLKLYKGNLDISLTAYLVTDYENHWTEGIYFMIQHLVDKLIYRNQLSRLRVELVKHASSLYGEIRSHLNMEKFL